MSAIKSFLKLILILSFGLVLGGCSSLANYYNNKGYKEEQQGKYDAAISNLNKAIKNNPNMWEAYNNRGLSYHHKKKYDQAIADYNKAIELNPKEYKPYGNRGLTFYNQQMYD